MLSLLALLREKALDLLFPCRCVGCGKEGDFICPDCQKLLRPVETPFCPICGKPQNSDGICASCRELKLEIDGIRSVFRFEGVAREAVHQLKYNQVRALAPRIGEFMTTYLRGNHLPGEVLVPVPLHAARLRERGYNQSALLAGAIGWGINLPVNETSLRRNANAPPQARTKSVSLRYLNVAGAFVSGDACLRGRGVILVDDVATSGATLNECARVLKSSGVTSVWGLTFAREV
ncbi:MAG: ComF family protein [Chloroflexota bacterium]